MALDQKMESYALSVQEEIKQIIRDMCAIPAPSHHEEKRAEFCKKWFEDNGFEIQSCEFVRLPNDTKTLTDEQRESVQKLIDRIEEDEDVQNVFTNIAE